MGWLKKAAGWVVAAVVTVLGAIAALWYAGVLRNKAAAANARANATERILTPSIKKKQKKLEALEEQAAADSAAVKVARDEVNTAKAALANKFQAQGLTADEIVARFERLSFGKPDGIS